VTTTNYLWYADSANVLAFGQALNDADFFTDPSDVLYYFKKPRKYEREYEAWVFAGKPSDKGEEHWQWFLAKLDQLS
jgi:hypothetical protein